MSAEKYRSEQVQRALRVMLALGPTSLGLLLKDGGRRRVREYRAARPGEPAHRRYSDRSPHDDKRWLLGPRLVQLAFGFDEALRRGQDELNERRQRYTRLPN